MVPKNIIVITGFLFIWNLVIIHYISRWVYFYFKDWENVPAEYVARKVIHSLGGGITAITIPLYYVGYYWVVSLSSFLIAGYLQFWRSKGGLKWFQVEDNNYEVHFAISYGIVILISILLGDIWIGLTAILFMSFGDSATGLVRAFRQKRHIKTWDGTLAMFFVSSIIGYFILGWFGILIAAVVSLVEKIPEIDDNITIPIVSVILTYLGKIFLNL